MKRIKSKVSLTCLFLIILSVYSSVSHGAVSSLFRNVADYMPRARHTRHVQLTTVQYKVAEPGNDTSSAANMCNITVPDSVKVNKDIWTKLKTPLNDDLDRYMINKTGCEYRAYKYWDTFSAGSVLYNGTRAEWRGAVRTAAAPLVRMYGLNKTNYNFYLGNDTSNVATNSTIVLSDERYVPIYIRIDAGILSFGTECDGKTFPASDVPVRQGQLLNIEIYPGTSFGMKWLYDCPATS